MAELFYFCADFVIYFSLISCFGTVGYFVTLIGFDGGASSLYRKDDGVSFVQSVVTERRIQLIKNSFENITINRYEDNLKKPSV